MKIEIAVERENAHFDFNVVNFPARFIFLDRSSKVLVEVNLELDTFKNLMKEIREKINVDELMKDAHVPHITNVSSSSPQ